MTLAFLAIFASDALAYGPRGHLIAGRVAGDLLCARAAAAIADLRGGEDLGEIGLWADQIRSNDAYDHAAPWHYMNVADGERLAEFEHPPEGDVLWAIGHFSAELGDTGRSRTERSEALAFLVHFIVDIHQPLHVGLAEDRGGNAVELRYQGERTNLHRLWDTDVIDWTGLSVAEYAASITAEARGLEVSLDPLIWAEESLALRARVYAYGREGRQPSRAYLDAAADITRERLALAALRLAGTLNAILC
jgi:nuclease S1